MSQQINLYNPIFRQPKKYFSARTMLQASGLIIGGAVLLAIFISYRLTSLRSNINLIAQQQSAVQAQLAKVSAESSARQKNKMLENDIAKYEHELKGLEQILGILKAGDFGNAKGHSEYFRAFARQIIDGLWLTAFNINGKGEDIAIQGRALRPELIPTYISRLKNEPILQGKAFDTLEMQIPTLESTGKEGQPKASYPAPYVEFKLESAGQAIAVAPAAGTASK